jgi:UDP-glucose 4-epimerase
MKQLGGSRVLVTGGLGFIGSHLVRRLLAEGCEVYVFGNTETCNVSDVLGKIRIHDVDLRRFEDVKRSVEKIKPMKIFHLAAHVNVSRSLDPAMMIENNFGGTVNLLKAAESVGYDCLINTGTCEEYGTNPVPFKEDQVPNPVSPYSVSKVKTTLFCQSYQKETGRPIITLRPFLTYGPSQRNNFLIPYIITSSLFGKEIKTTRGEQAREFNYVSDIIDGYILAAASERAVGEIINVGNGKEYKIRDVIRKILDAVGSSVKVDSSLPYRNGEAMHFYCSNEKARKLLGWRPKTSLDDGLRKTIGWYKQKFDSGELKKWLI